MNRYEFYSNLQTYKNKHEDDTLIHYGTLGQKWGVRHWQNQDGTFNAEGKERYFGKSSKNSSEDNKVGGLFRKKKKNEDVNTNKNVKKEIAVDKLNKLLEEEAKRREKYKYIQEKNENGKYEDEYGEYDNPDFDSENEKIGGLFNKTPEEKEFKEAKRLAQKLNFDNGTKVIKELKNTEYGKKHIKPLYDEFEENMNKLSDKANKIIKDNPVDEIEAGIANAIDTSGGNANIGYIINCIRKQHYANSADGFINVDSLPLLKSEEDLFTESQKYKKDFGDKIEKGIKNLYPKAKTDLSYFIALTDYENDKLEKVNNMNDEDYRRYQLYHQVNYGLVPEINKKSIRKDIIEPAEKLYPKVEKIINNTKVGDPNYDWSDIGKALVKLGLDDKGADELTSADWKKVYDICKQA